MWIKRATFLNFCRHRNLSLEFPQGLVGIVGTNGVGKTTITDGLYAALTNDFGRFPGVKADCVNDMAEPGEESSITVEAEHNGMQFELKRYLRPNKQVLTINGGKPITKAPDIDEALTEHLGVNNNLIGSHVFIPQWGMFDFLSQTVNERAAAYQQLCGTLHAVSIYNGIDAMLGGSSSLLSNIVDNSDELRSEILAAEIELQRVQAGRKMLAASILSDENVTRGEGVLRKAENCKILTKSLDSLMTDADTIATELYTASSRLNDTKADVNRTAVPATQASRLSEARSTIALIENARSKRALAETCRGQLVKAKAQLAAMHEPAALPALATRNKLVADIAELQSSVSRNERLIKRFSDSGVTECPTCGTSVTDLKDHMRIIASALPLQREALEALTEKLDTHDAQVARITSETAARTKQSEIVTQLTQRLEAYLSVSMPDVDEEAVQATIGAIETAQNEADTAVAAWRKATDAHNRVSGRMITLRREIERCETDLADQAVSDALVMKATTKLAEHREAQIKDAAEGQRQSGLINQLAVAKKSFATLRTKLEQQQIGKDFADRLTLIRENVFHRTALPRLVAQANLQAMETDINTVLSSFGSPFWVETTEDLSFIVHFPGEPARRAERLSGGQKGVLAVAFRIAVSRLFGAELGLMALDEPTAGMDEQNVGYLAAALSAYASQVRGKRQVLMITHSPELRPAFDKCIEIVAA